VSIREDMIFRRANKLAGDSKRHAEKGKVWQSAVRISRGWRQKEEEKAKGAQKA